MTTVQVGEDMSQVGQDAQAMSAVIDDEDDAVGRHRAVWESSPPSPSESQVRPRPKVPQVVDLAQVVTICRMAAEVFAVT